MLIMSCKVTYKNGFNEEKRDRYNNFLNYLTVQSIIDISTKNNVFIAIGSPLPAELTNEFYKRVKNHIVRIIKETDGALLTRPSTKKGSKQFDKVIEDLTYIYKNFEEFKSYNIAKSSLKITEDVEAVNNTNQEFSEKFKDSITTSAWDRSDFKIRQLFNSIPVIKRNRKGETSIVINPSTGLPKMVDGVSLFTRMSIELSNTSSFADFNEKINSSKFKILFPEIDYIMSLFPKPSDNSVNKLNSLLLENTFYNSLNKAIVGIVELRKQKGQYFTRKSTVNNKTIIRNFWVNNFNTQSDNAYVKTIENKKTLIDIPTLNSLTEKDITKYLSYFGIILSPAVYMYQKETLKSIFSPNKPNNFQNALNKHFLHTKNSITDFASYFRSANDAAAINVSKFLKQLESIESDYSTLQPSTTALNSENELMSSVSEKNSLTVLTDTINNSKSIQEVYKKLPALQYSRWFKPGSFWYDKFFSDKGKKLDTKFVVENYSGLKDVENPENSNVTAKMTLREKLIMDLNSMNPKNPYIDIPRTSTSDTYYTISVLENGKSNQLINSSDNSVVFMSMMLNYLHNELTRNKEEDNKEKYYVFTFLSKELKSKLEKLSQGEIDKYFRDKISNPILTEAQEEINKYFNKELTDLKALLNKYNIDAGLLEGHLTTTTKTVVGQEEVFGTTIDKIETNTFIDDRKLLDTIRSYFINSVEVVTLIYGDPVYAPKDFHKRFKGLLSTGSSIVYSDNLKKFLKDDTIEGNMYSIGNQNNAFRDNSETILVKTFKDAYFESKAVIKKILKNTTLDKKLIEKAYGNVNVADGQGIVNIDFYREALIAIGNWSVHKEIAFIYNGLIYKKEFLKKRLTLVEEKRLEQIQDLIDKDVEGSISLPPLKMQYFGPYANIEGYKNSMDKFSLVPALPAVAYHTKNKVLGKLITSMAKNKTAYVKYESAAKTHQISVVPFGTGLDTPEYHYTPYLKEQIRTATSLKTLVTWGSQFRKLLFSGLYSSGQTSENINQSYKKYLEVLKQVAEDAKETLFKDMGIELDIENSKVYIKDYKTLVTKLKRQAANLGLSNNIIDGIEYNPETGELLNSFESTGVATMASNMIFGLIDKQLRVWKTNGNQYIQVSNHTYDNLAFYDLVETENGKRTTPAQVRISLTGSFKKLLRLEYQGETIKTLERLNEALKDPVFRQKHKRSLTLIGYRIPTQELNSTEYVEIHSFLDPTAGNIIHLYDEITGKAGSDFDIDKLSMFLPSFDEDGNYLESIDGEELTYEAYEKLKKAKKERVNFIDNYVNSLRQEIKFIKETANKERRDLKDDLFVLNIEKEYLLEEIQYQLENYFDIVENDDKFFPDFVNSVEHRSQQLIDGIFGNPNTIYDYRQQFDANLIKLFEDAIKIEKTLEELNFISAGFSNEDVETFTSGGQEFVASKDQIYSRQDYNNPDYKLKKKRHIIEKDNLHTIAQVKQEALKEYIILSEEARKKLFRIRNKKQILTNQLLELYSEIYQQPEAYEQLVKPNSADYLNEIIQNNYKNENPDNLSEEEVKEVLKEKLPFGSKVFQYLTNVLLHGRLKLSGAHLAIYAKANTSHALATQLGLYLNPEYEIEYKNSKTGKREKRLQPVNMGLLTSKEEAELITKDGYIDMGRNINSAKEQIHSLISKSIDVTVDAEKNPQYLYANITNENISMVLYLLRQSVPYERVVDFISLAPIKEYFKLQEQGLNKKTINARIAALYGPFNQASQYKNKIKLNINKLKAQVKTPDDADFISDAYELLQRTITEANFFDALNVHFDYDTNKIESPISATKKANDYRKLLDSKLITTKSIKDFANNSIISVFNNNSLITNITEQIFPIIYEDNIVDAYIDLASQARLKQRDLPTYEKIVTQEYLLHIIDNYGIVDIKGEPTNIALVGDILTNSTALYNKINRLPDDIRETYSIFSQIKAEAVEDKTLLSIIRDVNNKGSQINILSQELEALLNFEDVDNEYTEEEVENIRSVTRNFCIVAIKQGFSKTRFYLEDIVPLSFKQDIYNNAIERFLTNPNKQLSFDNVEDFQSSFKRFYKTKFFSKLSDVVESKYAGKIHDYSIIELVEKDSNFTLKNHYSGDIYGNITLDDNNVVTNINPIFNDVNLKTKLILELAKKREVFSKSFSDLSSDETDLWERMVNDAIAVKLEDKFSIPVETPSLIEEFPENNYEDLVKTKAEEAAKVNEDSLKNATNVSKVSKVIKFDETKIQKQEYKRIYKASTKFYSVINSDTDLIPQERWGQQIVVPGYEDILLMLEQDSKKVFELSTGLLISTLYTSKDEVVKELANLFKKKNIYGVLESTNKVDFNKDFNTISGKKPKKSKNIKQPKAVETVKTVETKESSPETARTIYDKLGKITQSLNVEIPGKGDLKGVKYEGKNFWKEIIPEARAWFGDKLVIAYRGNKEKSFLQNYKGGEPALTIGNPFDWQKETGTSQEQGIKSTKRFIHWMITGDNMGTEAATKEYRQAIIDDIKSGKLKGRAIIYYEEKGYATHATALDYLIHKYDWNNAVIKPSKLSKVTDVEELALLNKDREVEVTFITKTYNNTFKAIVTGKTEVISEGHETNTKTGETFNHYTIRNLVLETKTGKLITASETDISGLITETIRFEDMEEFTDAERSNILTNFALKHKMSEEQALNYINKALLTKREEVIDTLKKCY